MTFDEMMSEWKWESIQNCPGRFKLQDLNKKLTVGELLAVETEVQKFQVSKARDTVLVVPFFDGGIISYERDDGTYLHTLNDENGFSRKLSDLDIRL